MRRNSAEEDQHGRDLLTETPPQAPRSDAGELSEAEAIRLAQQGDERAFERIYGLHSRRIYALCFRMMRGNAAEAEELTQESFLQLFRKIGTFRGESAFSTWLHRLAFNIVLMRLRRRTYQVLSLDEMLEPGTSSAGLQKHIARRDPRLSGSLDRMDLERALEQLPPGYKAVFILHDVQGYEHNEIAAIRGCSLGNSKSQLHKARARLRELLHAAVREKDDPISESMEALVDEVSTVL
jgi:RNA polymerase sigma-70 factor (ECF subfamily)